MKTANNKTARDCGNTRAKTGFLSIDRIRNTLHFKQTFPMPTNQITSMSLKTAVNEKENLSNEIEAELKRAQARTYANALLLR